ncbi:MAG: hypothetical protein CM15mV29_0970 [uncultured marine virus]|nr:MAG: hypothetical protein CM15mV29_0970 [uncultured marine virus]
MVSSAGEGIELTYPPKEVQNIRPDQLSDLLEIITYRLNQRLRCGRKHILLTEEEPEFVMQSKDCQKDLILEPEIDGVRYTFWYCWPT